MERSSLKMPARGRKACQQDASLGFPELQQAPRVSPQREAQHSPGAAEGFAAGGAGVAATAGRAAGFFAAVAFACFSASAAASFAASPAKCFRASSACSRSSELECVFFSVTPISGRNSIRTFAFTSSSRASSLIRI